MKSFTLRGLPALVERSHDEKPNYSAINPTVAKAIEDVLVEQGDNFTGGKSIVKEYISSHQYLVPAPRQASEPQRKHRRRYFTGSGEGDIKTAQSAST